MGPDCCANSIAPAHTPSRRQCLSACEHPYPRIYVSPAGVRPAAVARPPGPGGAVRKVRPEVRGRVRRRRRTARGHAPLPRTVRGLGRRGCVLAHFFNLRPARRHNIGFFLLQFLLLRRDRPPRLHGPLHQRHRRAPGSGHSKRKRRAADAHLGPAAAARGPAARADVRAVEPLGVFLVLLRSLQARYSACRSFVACVLISCRSVNKRIAQPRPDARVVPSFRAAQRNTTAPPPAGHSRARTRRCTWCSGPWGRGARGTRRRGRSPVRRQSLNLSYHSRAPTACDHAGGSAGWQQLFENTPTRPQTRTHSLTHPPTRPPALPNPQAR